MRKIRDALVYSIDQRLPSRKVGRIIGIHPSTVCSYLNRYRASGLPWPLPEELDDAALEKKLFPGVVVQGQADDIDFDYVHAEMRKRGSSLSVLHAEWEEHTSMEIPISYSQYCRRYNEYVASLRLSMRRTELFGENCYVDYSGMTIIIHNRETGETRSAQVFVGVLGGSIYTYCEATWSQRIRDWISSHVRMFEYFGGVSRILVPDNLKAAVTKAHRHEPEINPSYEALCRHYGIAPLPARSKKPKDKARAEGAVNLSQRWILFSLRKRTFYSLEEANREIRELLNKLNHKPFQKRVGSRHSRWLEHELPTLQPLPAQPYEFAEWGKVRAGTDYHVRIDGHAYSVPYQLRGKEFDYRLTDTVVELIFNGQSEAVHPRSFEKDQTSTQSSHQPREHREMQWDRDEALAWASAIGPNTTAVLQAKLEGVSSVLMGYRATQTMKALLKAHGQVRLEEVCAYAAAHGITKGTDLRNVLDKRLDRLFAQDPIPPQALVSDHQNIRGADYYNNLLSTDVDEA
ncbi:MULTISPECIES: IS21 family transposase [Pseudomonadota]|uniref:IS21 family transposase n=2 Tax=Pseudomonas TaxID=286 RepID=A0A931D1N9_9PSED|nr:MULTISPECIES: IS21 family transposase [Pseudomonadota]MBZ9667112.1 IS21 family transposase [Pseudomonas chaetocerotis]MDN5506405.1 IS21 family transposase [Comamonas sp.]MDN5537042.1 IS21 family transposase [Comamonas sp.]HBO7940370.1 IS21 family transposase [Pseudomonas aeruginosa]HBO8155358.1 IS21 family transposase [Pseudomonas aeruginosa]